MLDKSISTVIAAESGTKPSRKRLPDAVRGVLAGFSANGDPLVDFSTNSTGSPVLAASVTSVQPSDIGREAILVFEDGDPSRPIVVGLVHQPVSQDTQAKKSRAVDVTLDGQRLTLTAQDEIVLRCGEASVTLRRNGRVVIRGAYVESRSRGTNRIKGGSVLIN